MSDTVSDIHVRNLVSGADDAPDGGAPSNGSNAAPGRSSAPELADGRALEKYRLQEEVGQGGMAVVYRGIDTSLQREVAVKVLHPHLAKEEESKQRFQREAHAVAKLRHDNILEIYDYSGLDSDESFIVTEFIHGQTLKAFLNRTPISHPEIAAMIVAEVANALDHAHSFGIIHRDIKPENIMIRRDGRVKLMDFGIAQIIDVQKLTVTGQLLGSPAYMAPELVKGRPLDFRSDVFSMGTLLYQLTTGELPFKGRNPHEVLKRIADGSYVTPEIANPVVDGKMGRIVRCALAHEPDERYQTIAELREDLLAFLGDVGIKRPRQELQAYFTDTTGYSKELQDRVVTALTGQGKEALDHRDKVKALAYFDRVLCTDPRNSEVLELLEHLSRRRRLGRVVALLFACVLLAGGGWAVASYWPQRSAGGSGDASAAAAAPDAGGEALARRARPRATLDLAGPKAPLDLHPRDKGIARLVRPKLLRPIRRRIVRLRPVVAREVEILPHPKAVTIFLGKRRLGDYGPDLRKVKVPAGRQTLTFRNEACCFDKTVTIRPEDAPKQLRVKLAWKPARLKVTISPAGVKAALAIGKLVAAPGRSVPVPIPQSSLNGRTMVAVKVSAPGYRAISRKVPIRANGAHAITVILQRAQ